MQSTGDVTARARAERCEVTCLTESTPRESGTVPAKPEARLWVPGDPLPLAFPLFLPAVAVVPFYRRV